MRKVAARRPKTEQRAWRKRWLISAPPQHPVCSRAVQAALPRQAERPAEGTRVGLVASMCVCRRPRRRAARARRQRSTLGSISLHGFDRAGCKERYGHAGTSSQSDRANAGNNVRAAGVARPRSAVGGQGCRLRYALLPTVAESLPCRGCECACCYVYDLSGCRVADWWRACAAGNSTALFAELQTVETEKVLLLCWPRAFVYSSSALAQPQ